MDSTDPYNASRIARGATYLLMGKAVTSVAGIGTFLLLVRELPVAQFAAYSILFALVEIIEAVTGVGLSHVLSRYVPELHVRSRIPALRRLIALALTIRVGVLAAFLAIIYVLAPLISPMIGLADWEWAVKAYLAVVLLRVAATSLFGVLESMLNQAIAQLGFALVTVLRFALLAVAITRGDLDLKTVILIELITDAIGFGVMLAGLVWTLPRSPAREAGAQHWIRSDLGRMLDFGIKGYFQHLLILPYGGSTNRLLVGATLESSSIALFGFAQSIADLMERYLPVRLLAGVIRPVLTARYVRDGRFGELVFIANLIFKLNAVVICLVAVVVFSGGTSLLAFVSSGKYVDSVGLLVLMCLLVLMFSLRHMLDHVSHAVERNGPLIWSNAIITLSIVPGILLLPLWDVYALPAANLLGTIIGCGVLGWRLSADGFRYRLDIAGLSRLLAATAGAFVVAECCRLLSAGWVVSTIIASTIFVAALQFLRAFNPAERDAIVLLMRRSRLLPSSLRSGA